jgi:hypothetical protein
MSLSSSKNSPRCADTHRRVFRPPSCHLWSLLQRLGVVSRPRTRCGACTSGGTEARPQSTPSPLQIGHLPLGRLKENLLAPAGSSRYLGSVRQNGCGIAIQALVFVATFDRGVRPMKGFWVTCTIRNASRLGLQARPAVVTAEGGVKSGSSEAGLWVRRLTAYGEFRAEQIQDAVIDKRRAADRTHR